MDEKLLVSQPKDRDPKKLIIDDFINTRNKIEELLEPTPTPEKPLPLHITEKMKEGLWKRLENAAKEKESGVYFLEPVNHTAIAVLPDGHCLMRARTEAFQNPNTLVTRDYFNFSDSALEVLREIKEDLKSAIKDVEEDEELVKQRIENR